MCLKLTQLGDDNSGCGDSEFDANSNDDHSNRSVDDKIVSEFVRSVHKQVPRVSRAQNRLDAKDLLHNKRGASEESFDMDSGSGRCLMQPGSSLPRYYS